MDILLQQFEVGPMDNFIYFLGDPESKQVAVIDPAWDVPFILSKLETCIICINNDASGRFRS